MLAFMLMAMVADDTSPNPAPGDDDEDNSFFTTWVTSYQLSLGEYNDKPTTDPYERIIYILSTIFL